jgi:hypothetical protein
VAKHAGLPNIHQQSLPTQMLNCCLRLHSILSAITHKLNVSDTSKLDILFYFGMWISLPKFCPRLSTYTLYTHTHTHTQFFMLLPPLAVVNERKQLPRCTTTHPKAKFIPMPRQVKVLPSHLGELLNYSISVYCCWSLTRRNLFFQF